MRYTTQIIIHMFETIFLRISLTALTELLAVAAAFISVMQSPDGVGD